MAALPDAPAPGTTPHAGQAAVIVRALAAAPRPAGSDAERAARTACAAWLAALGFTVREEPFTYSALPGRWGTPLAGLAIAVLWLAAGHVGNLGAGGPALAILAGGLALLAGVGAWAARRGVLTLPWLRREGVNLVAERGGAPGDAPVWLMAHLDSKSQPVPIAGRAAAISLTALLLGAALVYAAAQWAGLATGAHWLAFTIAGVLVALPIIATTVGSRSPGALDDASGVATVLLAAAALPRDRACGVCLTSAEELGLAGARAWVATRRAGEPRPVLNVDGVDDVGGTRAMWSRRRPTGLLRVLAEAGAAVGVPCAARRLLPGILTDGVAIADAGWPTVTVSRGTVRTLLRIHSPGDRAEALTGEGIASTARLVARAADTLARSDT